MAMPYLCQRSQHWRESLTFSILWQRCLISQLFIIEQTKDFQELQLHYAKLCFYFGFIAFYRGALFGAYNVSNASQMFYKRLAHLFFRLQSHKWYHVNIAYSAKLYSNLVCFNRFKLASSQVNIYCQKSCWCSPLLSISPVPTGKGGRPLVRQLPTGCYISLSTPLLVRGP